ncbi:hypothetical protein A2W70_02335 [Candidatus Curtissbacteria bacterium RIFCSPLOWO2_02_41_11]|uniref:Methyltransferase type 11 domain-containing protein n=1 Tax=Candidatus Curtissbacteria bacterium RIFCSPLOWO2_02_41_11 TaxID=1797731 RepID=A0A1F5HU51_9BACT|nr:MAG: hypothetical protein A2W70_02335 [Candidatus Curtissbacteria bacterium RIFCSPLOWO2_02_41_11]
MIFKGAKLTETEILNYYRYKAPTSAMDSPQFQRTILQEALKELSAKTDLSKMKVLDFGCGLGNNLKLFMKYFAKITAADISPNAISLAKKNRNLKKIDFILLNKNKLPFKPNSFDFILAAEALEHVPNLTKTMSQLKRILKKNGYILISAPNYWNPRGISKKIIDFFTREGFWDPGRAHPGGYERFMTPPKLLNQLKGFKTFWTHGSDYGTAWSPPMIKMYPKKFDNFFEISLGKVSFLKKCGMNYYLLAQKLK